MQNIDGIAPNVATLTAQYDATYPGDHARGKAP
jgi:hypothetical protein